MINKNFLQNKITLTPHSTLHTPYYKFADAHCDTLIKILDKNQRLYKNNLHVDIERLMRHNCKTQFFAVWIDPKYEAEGTAFDRAVRVIDNFHFELRENAEYLHHITTGDDVDAGKIGALLSIEGGGAIEGDIQKLHALYNMGVRAMTLTWNGRNAIADGVLTDNPRGLTPFGCDVVREMNTLGMIVDVSHISEEGFWDVANVSAVPFIASHSNAKAVCNHARNLTDEQIKHIIKINGFIGLNFCSDFLRENGSTVTDIIRHAEHILSLGGENVLGLGADFDGVEDLPEGITDVSSIALVVDEFFKLGYSEGLMDRIMYGNLNRVVKLLVKL